MKKDAVQLQQKLIYYRSELDKYKKKVQDYQENYHYSMLESLKNENEKLKQESGRWSEEEAVLKGELAKRNQTYQLQLEKAQTQEEQFKAEIKKWQAQVVDLREAEKQEKAERKQVEAELGEYQQRFFQAQRDTSMLQKSYAELKVEIQREQDKQRELQKRADEIEKLFMEEGERTRRMLQDHAFLMNSYLDAQRQLQIERQKNAAFEQEASNRKSELEEVQKQFKNEQEQVRQLKGELQKWQTAADQRKKEEEKLLHQMEDQMASFFGEAIRPKHMAGNKSAFMKVLETKIEELTSEIEASEQQKDK
ncbi:hypothetical protein GLW03_09980 [Halobacillus halophilus]|uniref:hypothetical protein n=1 Tax=Halobacillus halophilus TaxID=1570 RepID=UPI00136BA97D|nr:hypothetical protein [Halobacillus halophilus]MYL30147.1 hypothetical protein [Halobacillus halophilus]